MKWILSIITIIVGMLLVVRTQWIYDFTGPIDWAEQHLGTSGGTRLLIKLIGLVFIIGAFLAMTGILGNLVRGAVSPFLNV